MKLRGFAVLFFAFGLAALGQQDQTPSAAQGSSPSASSEDSKISEPPKLLTPDVNGALSQEQIQALIRTVAQNHRENYKKQHDYTYIDREVERKLDSNRQVKSTQTKTFEVMELYGEPIMRLIEKDDKPLNEKDAAKEEERIQKIADKRKNESEEERRKRDAEKEKARIKGREFVSEIADAYNFRLVGSEILNGRDNWVIAGEPRPDFRAHLKEAEMLSKIHGRLWIDKEEIQLAKMDIEAIDTLSFGWVLARIHKGTRFVYEETRVNDEVWLPLHYEAKVDVRLALFKNDNEQDEGSYRDYKKFRTSAKIVGMGEVKEQK
ncbi:MAG TPA: hypothetical protein VJ999_10750 [Candidatus Sulfotelmatobacter sp.]|nr:hypothetical protein [Candidatus Sulfotelmatobacter sp.]